MAGVTRKLTVTTLEEIKSGSGTRGSWTLSRVQAIGEDGHAIAEQLKTFEALPVGELIEVTVEQQEHERFGVSYLLKRVRASDGLRHRVEALEQRVAALESDHPREAA